VNKNPTPLSSSTTQSDSNTHTPKLYALRPLPLPSPTCPFPPALFPPTPHSPPIRPPPTPLLIPPSLDLLASLPLPTSLPILFNCFFLCPPSIHSNHPSVEASLITASPSTVYCRDGGEGKRAVGGGGGGEKSHPLLCPPDSTHSSL